ncbi:22257_t:CDS:2 [Dentiscutata erythropus]|uniref:22257_t:CDS:1 n=1 Tax=Dentiscutata erythropus TaxID=1348616 RepID=A0A9N9E6V8_9GLOM|nr:22257_t:CDS:2 [Dentiscutata erythropus]
MASIKMSDIPNVLILVIYFHLLYRFISYGYYSYIPGFTLAVQAGYDYMYKYLASITVITFIVTFILDYGPDFVMWLFAEARKDFKAKLMAIKKDIQELESSMIAKAKKKREKFSEHSNLSDESTFCPPVHNEDLFGNTQNIPRIVPVANDQFDPLQQQKDSTYFKMSYKVDKGLRTLPFAANLPAVDNPQFAAKYTTVSSLSKGEWPSPPRKEPCRYISNDQGAYLKLRLGHPEELSARKTELPEYEAFRPTFGSPLCSQRMVEVGPQNRVTVISPRFLKGANTNNRCEKRPSTTRRIIQAAFNRFKAAHSSPEFSEQTVNSLASSRNNECR